MTPFELIAYILIAVGGLVIGSAHYNKLLILTDNYANTYVIHMVVAIVGTLSAAWAINQILTVPPIWQ